MASISLLWFQRPNESFKIFIGPVLDEAVEGRKMANPSRAEPRYRFKIERIESTGHQVVITVDGEWKKMALQLFVESRLTEEQIIIRENTVVGLIASKLSALEFIKDFTQDGG